jgi:hypothetical protein
MLSRHVADTASWIGYFCGTGLTFAEQALLATKLAGQIIHSDKDSAGNRAASPKFLSLT